MRVFFVLALAALGTVAGCRPQPAPDASPASAAVWMVRTYTGGQQCQPRQTYAPPNVAADLAREGVELIAAEVEQLSVCQACTCPAYAARHFVQVRAADVEKVAALGFERAQTPPAE